MVPSLAMWIAIPLIGGFIGYITNWLAVKMIFRPIKPISILGIRVQGLIGRRQRDLAQSIGRVVGGHLVQHEDLVKAMAVVDLKPMLSDVLSKGLGPKIDELRNLPLIGGFLTSERIDKLRGSIIDGILEHKEAIFAKLEEALEKGLDVHSLVAEKVAEFPVEKVESLILEVASKELRAIEWLGGLLGVLIGVGQVGVTWATA